MHTGAHTHPSIAMHFLLLFRNISKQKDSKLFVLIIKRFNIMEIKNNFDPTIY